MKTHSVFFVPAGLRGLLCTFWFSMSMRLCQALFAPIEKKIYRAHFISKWDKNPESIMSSKLEWVCTVHFSLPLGAKSHFAYFVTVTFHCTSMPSHCTMLSNNLRPLNCTAKSVCWMLEGQTAMVQYISTVQLPCHAVHSPQATARLSNVGSIYSVECYR